MKGFKIFLSYYSIVVVTVLLIGSAFFVSKPYGYIHLVLFLPVVIYFWLTSSGPKEVNSAKWSLRFLSIIIIFSVLGIYGLFLSTFMIPGGEQDKPDSLTDVLTEIKTLLGEKSENNDLEDIAKRLEDIEESLTNLQYDGSDTLGVKEETESIIDIIEKNQKEATGYVTVKSEMFKTVEVFERPNSSSNVVGSASFGVDYPFYESKGDWYEISDFQLDSLSDNPSTIGWVRAEFVKEKDN